MKPLLALFAIALAPSVYGAKQDLLVSIAAPRGGDAFANTVYGDRTLSIGAERTQFNVVITNVSSRTLSVFCDGNSWGDTTLSFLLTTANGSVIRVFREPQGYDRNHPGTVVLDPGESWIRPVKYDTKGLDQWKGWPALTPGQSRKATLVAVLEQHTEKWKQPTTLWSGKVTSKPLEVTFVGQ